MRRSRFFSHQWCSRQSFSFLIATRSHYIYKYHHSINQNPPSKISYRRITVPKASMTKSNRKSINIVKLKETAEKLQRRLRLLLGEECVSDAIRRGHFSVIVFEHERPKRMLLPLSILRQPVFLDLLEKAADEYGFEHEGALRIPCSMMEIERMLLELHYVRE